MNSNFTSETGDSDAFAGERSLERTATLLYNKRINIRAFADRSGLLAMALFLTVDIFDERIDYVLDAIDTLSAKWQLIKMCIKNNTKFISCTGMANRINPMEVKIMRLDKTSVDPICKILRNYARKDQVDMKKINVVVSTEQPIVQSKIVNEEGNTRKEMMPPASIMLVPSVAGITMAYYVLNDLLNLD